eukprot:712149-Prorocentrum_minimum.AAC.1
MSQPPTSWRANISASLGHARPAFLHGGLSLTVPVCRDRRHRRVVLAVVGEKVLEDDRLRALGELLQTRHASEDL